MEIAFKQNPRDRKLALQTADIYANAGQISKAEALYSEVLKNSPHDPELQQALKDLSARRTMAEGGYEKMEGDEGTFRNALRDKAEAERLEAEARLVKTDDALASQAVRLREQLDGDPDNVKALRQLADLLFQQKQYADARECLERIRQTDHGGDPAVDRRMTEIRLLELDDALAALDTTDVDYDSDARALQQQRLEIEIDSARQLAERYPSELQFRFELGKILFEAGKISEAIQEFQKAQANPHRRVATLNYLGQCFSKRGLHDVAVRTFQKALDEKANFDDEKKDLIYQLGLAQEAMGKREDAIESFKQIYEVDIGYRDVGARVDAYYADPAE